MFPLHIFVVLYRGYIFGVELMILCTCFSISGFFVAILLVVPQNIIFAAILVFSAPFNLECGIKTFTHRSLAPMKGYFNWLIFFFAVSLIGAIAEFFTVFIFFRPFAWVL